QVQEVLDIGVPRSLERGDPGLGVGGPRCGKPGSPRQQGGGPSQVQQAADHTSTSLMGLADLSTMRMGRPMSDMFSLSGSMPSARQMVARKSITATGRSSTVEPSGLVLPTTWPPLIPPPASTVVQALG